VPFHGLVMVHYALQVIHVVRGHYEEPAFVVGVFVEEFWATLHFSVDLVDFAADRGHEVGDCLDRFHCSIGLRLCDGVAFGWELNIDYFAELFLGVIGDADADFVTLDFNPLEFLGVV
jgi:hypothetical protein